MMKFISVVKIYRTLLSMRKFFLTLFSNRATVKMANTDRACNFMFTNPTGLRENGLLYFADICAGAGGFSEHVLWRKK